MKPGDLVRVREPNRLHESDEFAVGNLDMESNGFTIPSMSVCVVVKIDSSGADLEEPIVHIMVPGGQIGWVYPEDCEAFSETG